MAWRYYKFVTIDIHIIENKSQTQLDASIKHIGCFHYKN